MELGLIVAIVEYIGYDPEIILHPGYPLYENRMYVFDFSGKEEDK